jgi:Tfp pilus assembly protein PilF
MLRSWIFIWLILLLAGCSLPRVIVLHDPLDARQHNDLGVIYQADKEFDLALREYQRAAGLDDRWARPLINGGNTLAALEQWSQAAELYLDALQRQPGQAEAMNNLAWALLQQGELAQARSWAEQAVAVDPGVPAYLDTLTTVRARQEETDPFH